VKNILSKIPASFIGEIIKRKEPCGLCKASKAKKIGKVDYWDIRTSDVVKCRSCGHIQLDPMLTHDETARGCLAYYIEESLRVNPKEQEKNLLRNFRRGVLFGNSLKKKGVVPKDILEFGPGSGYFADGIKFIFPETNITVMDVNKEVLEFNKAHHNYNTIESSIENFNSDLEDKFDLIIARDLLEHVIDVDAVINNVMKYSKDKGLFHFITPNGHEDVWKHYLRYSQDKTSSELLINHVNYFDGKSLLDLLKGKNFSAIDYYTYKIKTTIKGSGWKKSEKLMATASSKKNSEYYLNKANEIKENNFIKKEVLDIWYINPKLKIGAFLAAWFNHENLIRVDPKLNVGHEIYGLFRLGK